jgi:pimeloyl-ACP methyl ester carboxylesterase
MVSPGCVFWVNDDDDSSESTVHQDDLDAANDEFDKDYEDDVINGIRDLEDFMPFNITIPNIKEWTNNQNVKFFLKAEGPGKIKVYDRVKDLDKYEDFTYLKDLNSSIAQYNKPIILNVASGDEKELDSKYFDDKGVFHAIFEGVEKGSLKLTLEVELISGSTSRRVVLDEAVITLKDIRDMYRFIDVREGPTVSNTDDKLRYRNINVEKPDMFMLDPSSVYMFIHGAWTSESDAVTWSNTVYKRLYRTGYRGGFVGISWHSNEIGAPIDTISNPKVIFDNNWVNSFQTSQVLADVIENTKKEFKDAKISVVAHSLGGNLASYALRLLASQGKKDLVNNVFLIQVAVPGNAYATRTEKDYFKDMYVPSVVNNITGNVYNLYYENDGTLGWFNEGMGGAPWTAIFGRPGLPVPLDFNYEFLPSNKMHDYYAVVYYDYFTSKSEALGRQNLGSILSNFISSYRKFDDARPYGIRDHLSFGIEYYYDVKEYYMDILNPKNTKIRR